MPEYPLCKNRFYRLCRAVFFWCTALSFSLLAVCSIVVTAYFPEDYTEIPFLSFSAMPWVALGCGTVCAAGVWLAKCLHHVPPFALKLATCLCVFAVSAIWAWFNGAAPEADRAMVCNGASNLLAGDYSLLRPLAYYSQFPYQLGTTLWAALLAQLFGMGHHFFAFEVCNALFAALLTWFLLGITQLLTESRAALTACTALCIATFPTALFSTFIYGTLASAACCAGAVYYAMQAVRGGRWRHYLAACCLMALAILAKPNSAVFLVGLGLLYALAALRQRKARPLAGLALTVSLCLAASEAMLLGMEAVSGFDLHSGEPFTAWIAMGLQEGPLGPGWFNQYNDILYVLHQGDGAAITAEAWEMIKARCLTFVQSPGYAAHFFGLKTLTQWCEPTYASFWASCSALLDNLAPAAIRAFYAGPMHHAAVFAADVVQALTYSGAAAALWLRRRSWSAEALIPAVIVFGGFVFHTFWEAKSLYIWSYAVMMIPYAAAGLPAAYSAVAKRLRARRACAQK